MPLPEFKQLVDEAKSQIREIGPDELKRWVDAGDDFTLIDVREPDEHAKGMIERAIPVPRGIMEHDIDKVTTDKTRKIVLYLRRRLPLGAGGAESQANGTRKYDFA